MEQLFVERRLGFRAYEGVADLFGVGFDEFGEFLTEAEQASGVIGVNLVNLARTSPGKDESYTYLENIIVSSVCSVSITNERNMTIYLLQIYFAINPPI